MRILLMALWAALFSTAASAQSDYQIRSGDVLQIEVLEDPSLNREVLVLPDGRFSFPFAGTVSAGGRSIGEVQQSIASGIASNFAAPPNVFVSVRALRPKTNGGGNGKARGRTIDIYFVGEVNTPGQVEVPSGTSFLQAMSKSGGMTAFAAQKRINLRRTNPKTRKQSTFRINFKAIMDGGHLDQDIILQDGDVILVPERRIFE